MTIAVDEFTNDFTSAEQAKLGRLPRSTGMLDHLARTTQTKLRISFEPAGRVAILKIMDCFGVVKFGG